MPVVIVHYFAALREKKGRETERVNFEAGLSVGALYETLFPSTDGDVLPVAYAVNQNYVSPEHPLQDQDEVAFIPPLGGG